jgi:hypothetical protein
VTHIFFVAVALYVCEEGFDDLRYEEVDASEDEGDREPDHEFFLVGDEQVFEEAVGGVFEAEEQRVGLNISNRGYEKFRSGWWRGYLRLCNETRGTYR